MKQILFLILSLMSVVSYAQTNQAKWWKAIPIDTTITTVPIANGVWYYNLTTNKFTFYENGHYYHPLSSSGGSGLSTTLSAAHIYVGNVSNVATDVALSGDGLLSTSGSLTITGIRSVSIPSLSAGFLKYNGSAWVFDNSTYLTSYTETDPIVKAINGIVKSNGTTIAAASGTDINSTFGSQTQNFFYASPNGSSGSPSFRAIVSADIPTLNQNTTGSAAKWTTARLLAGNSVDGSTNVAFSNAFIVQGTSDSGLSGAQFLGALGTGIVKNTTSTGVLSIAVAGDFPTLNQNTTGSSGSVANSLTVDNSSLQLNSGTTFDGSAAKTISVKNLGITNAMIANSTIDLTAKVTGLLPDGNISSASNWNTAYNRSGTSLSFSASTFTFTKQDASTLTVSVPIFNQNTTGSAATLTTPRNIQGVSFNGSANIDIINGTGFVKASGTTLSYDNSTYLTTSLAASTYLPIANPAYTGTLSLGTLSYSDTDIAASFQKSVNSYFQIPIQNTNSGATASTDLIISSDNGTATTHYLDLGKNSSGFTGSGSLNQAGYSYLTSTTDDLVIGTTTNNALHLLVNNGTTDALTISGGGLFTLNSPLMANSWTGTATASANSQYFFSSTPTVTSRATASDLIGGFNLNATVIANSTSIDAIGITINSNLKTSSGLSTTQLGTLSNSVNYVTKSTTGMTVTTYTNVAPASTSGSGTGALFTVVVASATTFTSFTVTTSGSGYNVGETVTFNGSQFGSGSGSIVLTILTTANSLGANATALRIVNGIGDNNQITKRYVDFVKADGTTSVYSISNTYTGLNTTNLKFNDPTGTFMTVIDNSTVTINRDLATASGNNFTIGGTGAFTSGTGNITLSGSLTIQKVVTMSASNVGAGSGSVLTISQGLGAFTSGSNVQSSLKTSYAATVGVINTFSFSGTGTNGTYSGVSATGGTGSGAQFTVTVSGGTVTNVVFGGSTVHGSNYTNGDVLTVTITGGSATVTVTSIDFVGNVISALYDASSVTDSKSGNYYWSVYQTPTYNVTSTQAGQIGAFYWNPTLTATGSFSKYGIIIGPTGLSNGYGTTSPNATMHLVGSGSNPTLKIVGAGTGTNYSIRSFQSDGTTETFSLLDNGLATFGATTAIKGTGTNNNATAGNIGEEINSAVSTYTNYTTTATYQNIASITLTAGDWDISAFGTFSSNTATITAASNAIFVISTTTASAAGATEGVNILYLPQSALVGTSSESVSIPRYRVSLSGTTTYYFNTQATFTLGNPQFVGSIKARRLR